MIPSPSASGGGSLSESMEGKAALSQLQLDAIPSTADASSAQEHSRKKAALLQAIFSLARYCHHAGYLGY